MKSGRLTVLFIFLLAVATVYLFEIPYGPRTETFVDVPSGTGTRKIGALLEEHGIISNRYAFYMLRLAHAGRLQAGEFRFDHPLRMGEVYARLQRGDVYTRSLVIPPGYNIFDVAQAVQDAGLGSREAFLAAELANTRLVDRESPGAKSLEGFLFPDTYRFSRHVTPEMILTTMVKRWEHVAGQLRSETATWTPYVSSELPVQGHIDWATIVTMASLIEKEVGQPSERPLVAGVFVNRLRKGMPLQTDPAVIYAALLSHRYRGAVYASDLHLDSPYNTYIHVGLPPGPICSPGEASLKAALAPAKTDYLYFVSDAAGHTRFAATLEDHAGNVAAYRKAHGR